jgi:hypothetical protein
MHGVEKIVMRTGNQIQVTQPRAVQFTRCFIRTPETSYNINEFTSRMRHVTWYETLQKRRNTKIMKSITVIFILLLCF